MSSLIEIEGIGEQYARTLKDAGIRGTKTFLEWGATRQGRQQIVEKTGISEKLILEWLNHCDLMRIRGVGGEYSDLLEEAGVDTIVELGNRNAERLYQAMVKINDQKRLVRKMPTQAQVADWIAQASALPRILTY